MKVTNRKVIITAVLTLVVLIFVGYFSIKLAVNERLQELQLETQVLIAEQETLLTSIAEITARNGADELTERIIKDCSLNERNKFDELLSSLEKGLTKTQLVELERLFGRCGPFFAERKAVMVTRMSREIEVLELLVNQLSNLTSTDATKEYQLEDWKKLSELEIKQSDLFSSLVSLQDGIITELLEDNIASSANITAILKEVNTVQQELTAANSEASTVRATLVPL